MGEARIVLNLFSGRPNQEWPIEKAAADDLVRRLQSIPLQPRTVRPAIRERKPVDFLGRPRSGYRGFEVYADSESFQPAFQIYGTLVFEQAAQKIRTDNSNQWETFVWRTAPATVLEELDNITLAELQAPEDTDLIAGVEGEYVKLTCTIGPKYVGDTGQFHTFQAKNNCYNYATAKANRTKSKPAAIPGQANQTSSFSLDGLRDALDDDRLQFEDRTQPTWCPPKGAHWLAVMRRHIVGKLPDFHCLRLDKNGRWSQKDGTGAVENTDNDGALMTDLKQARLIGSPELAGFYLAFWKHRTLIN